MLLKSHDLNKYDIISPNSIYYEENKQYFNTTIKKIIKIKNSNIKDINLFINLLIQAVEETCPHKVLLPTSLYGAETANRSAPCADGGEGRSGDREPFSLGQLGSGSG